MRLSAPLIEPLETRYAPAAVITVADVSQQEEGTQTNPHNLEFIVKLSEAATSTITVDYSTMELEDGATAGTDFISKTGTLTFNPGETQKSVIIDLVDDGDDEANEQFKLVLSNASGATVQDGEAIGTILDAADQRVLHIEGMTVSESADDNSELVEAVFTLTLTNKTTHEVQAATREVQVHLETTNGSAIAGQDFTPLETALKDVTFAPGETTKQIHVKINRDTLDEDSETFSLQPSNPVNVDLENPASGTATITDNDPAPTMTITGVTISEGDSGTKTATFTVALSAASGRTITVKAATMDDTAKAGTDYTAVNTTVTFSPGQTTQTVNVPIIGDRVDELDEAFFLTLSDPTNIDLPAQPTAVGKILNDEIAVYVNDVQVSEGPGAAAVFTLTLNAPSVHPVTVHYKTTDGTAIAPGDYTAITEDVGEITFAPGEVTKTVSVSIADDGNGELNEDFSLNLTSVTNARIGDGTGKATILNDDPALRISDAQIVEGGVGSTTKMVFTVTLDHGPASGDVTVHFATADGSSGGAVKGTDYTETIGDLTFEPGETTKTIEVPIISDATPETAIENFTVTLSGTTNATIADGTGEGRIVDDDVPLVSIADVQITEGDDGTTSMVFVVSLSMAPTADLTVSYATADGTAVSGGDFPDYVTTTGSLVFHSGETQHTISVPIRGDTLKEGTQNFFMTLTGTSGTVAGIVDNQGVGTILDNDNADPIVSLTGGSVVEGNTGDTPSLVFLATLNKASDVPITVKIHTANGTAVAGEDYTELESVITFAPGVTSVPVSISVLGDDVVEGQHAFTAMLSEATGATIGTATATGTILDDDIKVSIADQTFTEGNSGTTTQHFTVTLSEAVPEGTTITVNFAVAAGTATLNTDFKPANSSTTLTFAAGETSKTIDFDILGDTTDENDETFTVTLTGATNASIDHGVGTGTIADDDAGPIISIGNATVTEGDPNGGDTDTATITFTVSLSQASAKEITVHALANSGTALLGDDFRQIADADQTITFAPGQTTKTVTLKIVGDQVDEAQETFTVSLDNAVNATIGDHGTGTGTINDDDLSSLSIGDIVISEGNSSTKEATFVIKLSAPATQTVTVHFMTADSTATAGVDYDPVSDQLVTFAPGSTEATVTVTIKGDTIVEPDDLFFGRLSNATGATIADGEATARILNDESHYAVTVDHVTAAEEGAGGNAGKFTFTITRTGDLSLPGSVSFSTIDGTTISTGLRADYVTQTGTVNFAPGQTTKTVTVQLKGDQNFENDETFSLRLTSSTNGDLVDSQGISHDTVEQQVTITDNDLAPTISIADVTKLEGTGGTPTIFTFTVRLSAANEKQTAVVLYSTQDGTAKSTAIGTHLADFTAISDGTLTFEKGEVEKTISISVNADSRDEAAEENFFVNLGDAKFHTVPDDAGVAITKTASSAKGTIQDDDATPTLSFDITNVSVTEGNAGQTDKTIKVKLNGTSDSDVTVSLDLETVGALLGTDFTADTTFPKTLTFAAGATGNDLEKSFTFTVLSDTRYEGDETITLKLSSATGATITTPTSTIKIVEDDPKPAITVNSPSVVEGEGGSQLVFTITLAGATDLPVTVDYATSDGTAKSTGEVIDYVSKSGTLTFAVGETTKTVTVPIVNDSFLEAAETFKLGLSNATNATIAQNEGTGTILPDADSQVGIIVRDNRVVEGNLGSSSTLTFTVELTGPAGSDTTFHFATRNGTATSGSDYTAQSQDYTIAAGQTSKTISVSIRADSIFEATESFFVNLSNLSSNATVVDGEARGSILNDDMRIIDLQTVQYVDEDGDIATVHISKGTLARSVFGILQLKPNMLVFKDAGTVGGKILTAIDLSGGPTHVVQYNGTDISITAEPQPGARAAGVIGDGEVDVGYIRANIPNPSEATFDSGIDLGNVFVEGDLAKITVGDIQVTPSILGTLRVHSLGARTDTLPTGFDNLSSFLSGVNSIVVTGDVLGIIQVVGGDFGDINHLTIGGALRGGSDTGSGQIFFTGTLANATIGSIIGGSGQSSGSINGTTLRSPANLTAGSIGTLRILHEIVGGSGDGSGLISAPTIGTIAVGTLAEPGRIAGGAGDQSGLISAGKHLGNVIIRGDLIGGAGTNAGEIFSGAASGTGIDSVRITGSVKGGTGENSGLIVTDASIHSVTILGNVEGGTGSQSGAVRVGRNLGTVVLGVDETLKGQVASDEDGNLVGGSGQFSGTIQAMLQQDANNDGVPEKTLGSITSLTIHGSIKGGTGASSGGVISAHALNSLDLRGSLIGGDSTSTAATVAKTGFISAERIAKAIIGGDIRAGTNGGTSLLDSGVIRVTKDIASLVIKGDVVGSATNRVIIAAGGLRTDDLTTPVNESNASITRLVVNGSATNLDVLGGYTGDGSADSPTGTAVNPDAQIGTVIFKDDVLGVNIASGVKAGTDGRFGTTDDQSIGAGAADILARIARVVFQGVDPIQVNSQVFGISAQSVGSITIGGTAVPLSPGERDDKEIGPVGSNMRVHEVGT